MDDNSQLLTVQAALAGLWRRAYGAFADSRITPLIVLLLTLGLLLPMAATGYVIFRSYLHGQQQQFDDDLHRTGHVLARSSSSLLWNLQRDIAEAMLQSHMTDERICEIAIQDALSGRVFIELKNAGCTGTRHAAATPILNGSTEIGTVRLVMGDGTLQAHLADRMRELVVVLGMQMLMLLSVVVPAVVFKIIRPLRRLHRQTGKLSGGELDLPFEWRRRDEIGQVGRAMDEARRQLKDLLEEQTRQAARKALSEQQREENLRLAAAVEQQTRSLRATTAQAQQSSQAKSAFLSTVSHELRAPLHDILGYAQLLTRQVAPGAQHQLAVIQESGQQLLHLIDDILDFSRGEAKPILLDPGPLSLSRLTEHLAEIYRPRAARCDNRLITRLETAATDWVLADERRLMQVLRNLLENACKFTQGGQIELGIAQVERPHPAAKTAQPLCLIEFSVSDTGVGIPAQHRARLFEPFNRLERDQRAPGLGLGLAIAQQLVRAMGGQIRVDSGQGEPAGSRFSFRLRLPISAPLGGEAESAAPITGYRGRRRTLLIADDFPTSRRYLADCCAAWGFDAILAEDGTQALAQLRTAEPPVDAALVDQFMPQLDGWGFLRRVRESEPTADLPVVLISAAPLQRPATFPQDLKFDAYAMKPLSEARLAWILEEVLRIEWEYADEPPAPGDGLADTENRPASMATACSTEELGQFRDMVALGQLMAIQQWARNMADKDPSTRPCGRTSLNCAPASIYRACNASPRTASRLPQRSLWPRPDPANASGLRPGPGTDAGHAPVLTANARLASVAVVGGDKDYAMVYRVSAVETGTALAADVLRERMKVSLQ